MCHLSFQQVFPGNHPTETSRTTSYSKKWEALNNEVIEQGFKANNVLYDAVCPARLLDVAKVELKA